MPQFDLEKYAPVEQRIADFYADHPEGTIRTFYTAVDERTVLFEARVYRTIQEAAEGIYTSGFAREVHGDGPVNKTSHVENCETSAIGRALANLNYPGSIDGKTAPRASREEMEKAGRPEPRTPPHQRKMPIGTHNKGVPLGDIADKDLQSALDWCEKTDAKKFADLMNDIRFVLASRTTPEPVDELPALPFD